MEIFIEAVRKGRYTCFVEARTIMPLMYMDDAIEATLKVMAAPADAITVRTSYNLTALSFTAGELAAEVTAAGRGLHLRLRTRLPVRRSPIHGPTRWTIRLPRRDWGWSPRYDLPALAEVMLREMRTGRAE